MVISGAFLGTALCEALGIDPTGVRRVIVDCQVGKEAKIITHSFVPEDKGNYRMVADGFKTVLRRYELKEVKNEDRKSN